VDYLPVGRMLGARPLGLYSMAYRLSESPSWAVADSVAMVTFPSFSRMRSRGEDIRVAFLSTLRAVALLTVPMGMALSAAADPFTRALLGRHWLPMIGPLAVLGLWAAVRPSQVTAGWFVNSVGHARSTAKVSAFTLALLIPAVIVGATLGAIEGVAVAMLGDVLLNLLLLGRIVSRAGGVRPAQQWSAVMPVVLVAPLAWVAGRAGVLATAGAPPAASLAASVAACLAAYLGLLALCAPAVLREGAAQVGRWLRRATSEEPALT
jgi:O-antigen/teichoic acid export membrane protein